MKCLPAMMVLMAVAPMIGGAVRPSTIAEATDHSYIALETGKDAVEFLDLGAAAARKDGRHAWTMTVFIPPRVLSDAGPPVYKRRTEYEFNCGKSRIWQMFAAYYDKGDTLLWEDRDIRQAEEIVPESLEEKVFVAACKHKAKRSEDVVIPNDNSALAYAEGAVAGRR
jgi:hypothetical protein